VSLRGRSAAVAIFKPKVWHPVARQGSTRREEIPITGTVKRAIPPSPLSPPDFQIPVRSVSPCFVPGCRLVPSKIAASGARALLAMTKLAGFAENETIFGTKSFESVPAGHRKNSAGLSAGHRKNSAGSSAERKKKAKEKSQCERIHTGFWCARRDLNPHVRSGH
jgi:hypothetical protein